MKQSFKKDICPSCKKVRIIVPKTMIFGKPIWRCTKCGAIWDRK